MPASRLRYTPLPHDDDWRLLGSPVPTYTIEGSDGASVTSPMLLTGWSSKTGSNVVPLLMVLRIPAEAVAT